MKPEAKNQEAYESNVVTPKILSKDGSQGLHNQAGCHAGKEKMLEARARGASHQGGSRVTS